MAAVVATVMLLSMSVAVFAADPAYTVTTEYVAGDTSKVQVTTVVTGVGTTEEVAVLVKNNETEDIIWIDQKEAEGGAATFTFKTSAANAKGALSTVSVGSETYASNAIVSSDNQIKLPTYTVNYTVGAHGKVIALAGSGANINTAVENEAVSTTDVVEFIIYPEAGYKLEKITQTVAGVTTELATVPDYTGQGARRKVAVTANTTFNFTFTDVGTPTLTAPTGQNVTVGSVIENEVTYKYISPALTTGNGKEYGILIKRADDEVAFPTDYAGLAAIESDAAYGIRKYVAMGANDKGGYYLQLMDVASDLKMFDGTEYKYVAYATNGVDDVEFSQEYTIGYTPAN